MRSNQEINCLYSIALELGVIEGIAMGLSDEAGGRRLELAAMTINMRIADFLDNCNDCSTTNAAEQPGERA